MKDYSVYVAAAATPDSMARVHRVAGRLRELGFGVSCTWPEVVAATPGGSNPRDASVAERHSWSAQDLLEIEQSDAVLFLVPALPMTTRGAWFESGFAFAKDKHLAFAGDTKQSVFCALGVEFSSDDDAIAHLVRVRDQLGNASDRSRVESSPDSAVISDDIPTTPPVVARGTGNFSDGGGGNG